uniref:Ald_Xan_dh_C2 domain-containing protein n=1 Tax=Echinostoma caproni TaxID=27848 RepID=A0A183A2I3_9TREM
LRDSRVFVECVVQFIGIDRIEQSWTGGRNGGIVGRTMATRYVPSLVLDHVLD